MSNMNEPLSDMKPQMFMGKELEESLTATLENDFPTLKDYRRVVRNIFFGDVHDVWNHKLYELECLGLDPWQIPGIVAAFRLQASPEMEKFKNRAVSVNYVALSNLSEIRGRMPRSIIVDEVFIIGCRPGGTGVIYGPPGTGKSNIAIGEIYRTAIMQENWEVDINIPLQDMAHNAKFNGTLSGTLLHGAEFAREMTNNGCKNFMTMWINDEAQFSRDRQRSGSHENIAMKQINLVARMFGFFQFSIMQQNKPPSEVADFCTHYIEKPSRSHPGNANLRVAGGYYYDLKLSNVPSAEERGLIYEDMTKLTYKIDINPLRLFDYISGLADKTGRINTLAQYDSVIEYIVKHKGEKLDIISDDVIAAVLYRARKRLKGGPDWREVTFKRLGKLVGWSEMTCKNRIDAVEQAEKDGLIIPDDTDDMISDLHGAVLETKTPLDNQN